MESDSSDSDIDIRVVLGHTNRPVAWDGRPTGSVLNIDPPPYRRRVHSKSSSYQGPAHTNTLMTPPDSPQSDLITYYNALSSNFFTSDPSSSHAEDPLHFLDESLFFVNQVESSSSPSSSFLPPGLGNTKAKSPSRDKKRIQFSTLLNDCYQHRMSTIAESDAASALNEDRPNSLKAVPSRSKEVEATTADDSDEAIQRRKSKSNKRVSWASSVEGLTTTAEEPVQEKDTRVESIPILPPVKPKRVSQVPKGTSTVVEQPQQRPALTIATIQTRAQSQNLAQSPKQGLKKLLDYIVPYPTRPPSKKQQQQQQLRQQTRRGRSASLPSRIASDSEEQDSSSATTSSTGRCSESTLGDGEEWVLHGFFEIRQGGEMVSTTTRDD